MPLKSALFTIAFLYFALSFFMMLYFGFDIVSLSIIFLLLVDVYIWTHRWRH